MRLSETDGVIWHTVDVLPKAAQPGTAVCVVMATPTTGASVQVQGCMMELRWYRPLP